MNTQIGNVNAGTLVATIYDIVTDAPGALFCNAIYRRPLSGTCTMQSNCHDYTDVQSWCNATQKMFSFTQRDKSETVFW